MDITFKRPALEDRDTILKHLAERKLHGCERTFANVYLWARFYNEGWAEIEGTAVFRTGQEGAYSYTYPIGAGDRKKVVEMLMEDAKEKGYAETMFGRRRPVPELSSSNFMQRSFGERIAMNSPIQGTAADIIKIAMIRVKQRLDREQLKSKLILQVHDELLIEAAADEEEYVKTLLAEEMRHAADLAVTLEVDVQSGKNWFEAH